MIPSLTANQSIDPATEDTCRKYTPKDLDVISLDELTSISWRSLFKDLEDEERDAMYIKLREFSERHLSNLSYDDLIAKLKKKSHIVYDLEFARRITSNQKKEVNYFFDPYSVPFLDNIAKTIAHESGYRDILGWYNDFVSPPYIDNKPQYGKVASYKGENFAHLYSWMIRITTNEAYKEWDPKKKGKLSLGRTESHDFESPFLKRKGYEEEEFFSSEDPELGWEVLTGFITDEVAETPEEHEAKITKVIHAFELLPEKDKVVLEYLVFDKMSNIDAFELMKGYVRPKPGSAPIEEWNNKKKSDTVSVWRDRAFIHLEDIYNDPRIK